VHRSHALNGLLDGNADLVAADERKVGAVDLGVDVHQLGDYVGLAVASRVLAVEHAGNLGQGIARLRVPDLQIDRNMLSQV
jgi:hypothetical protein